MNSVATLVLVYGLYCGSQNVVVVPTRATAIENLLRLYRPSLALIDTALTRSLPREWLSTLPVVKGTPGTASQVPMLLCHIPCHWR